jgi:hypothetical protein
MQLTKPREERRRELALAVLALLGTPGVQAQSFAAPAPGERQNAVVDSGFLWYQESDQRITDAEALISVRQPLAGDSQWNAHLTLDAVCGGSPIGALPSKAPQTFVTPTATSLNPPVVQTTTSASGGGANLSLCTNPVQNQRYTVAPGQLPIDRSFHDERIAASGGYETGVGELARLAMGAAVSHELDFFSASLNGTLSRDFDSHNTTLSGGVNLEADSIQPVGGTPVALTPYGQFDKGGHRSRNLQDAMFGVTQVMTRRWLSQFNLAYEHSSGYQTDPYKIVTQVDAQGNDPTGLYLYESRPELRRRLGLFWDNKYAFDRDTLQASWRHTRDSWGIRTDTFEMHYRLAFDRFGYLEPHLRAYRQSAADFFHFYLDQGAPVPAYASADPRLAAFNGRTLGLKYGVPVGSNGGELSLRAERYVQRGSGPANPPPGLQGLDLYPGMSAWILQAGVRFTF